MNLKPRLLSLSAALLAAIGVAAPSGLVVSDAAAQVARPPRPKEDDGDDGDFVLVATPRDQAPAMLAHRSHSSHSSHSSHYSGSRGSGNSGPDPQSAPAPVNGSQGDSPPVYTPPPKPGVVTLAAFPGGRISVDGKPVGQDATGALVLTPGSHEVRVDNRFVGTATTTIQIADGQTGAIDIEW
jgi:hypothetical protein